MRNVWTVIFLLLLGSAGLAAQGSGISLQVQLDRAHFSPGEIDGVVGPATRSAQVALESSSCAVRPEGPELVTYRITEADVAGPFVEVPQDMMEKAQLAALAYQTPIEALAEKFHVSPKLLTRLNEGKRFEPGTEIEVPNVERADLPKAARIVVDASERAVMIQDAGGCTVARYPATIGSANDPLPVGKWKVTEKTLDPAFSYNPDLFWDADPTHAKAKIAPGPNNPVGRVWIGLSKEHYGIHGTAEPANIGRTESHGCIRLTNWDALELAKAVSTGTPVVLQE